jgi:hypothetical protein
MISILGGYLYLEIVGGNTAGKMGMIYLEDHPTDRWMRDPGERFSSRFMGYPVYNKLTPRTNQLRFVG